MIELCYHYTTTGYPTFKPRCKLGHWASLKCHSRYCKCPKYSATGGHTRGHTISMLVLDEFADYSDLPNKYYDNQERSNTL